MALMAQRIAVKTPTPTQPRRPSQPSGETIPAAEATANPAMAKPICVPIAIPESRTFVVNISPYSAGQVPLAAE